MLPSILLFINFVLEIQSLPLERVSGRTAATNKREDLHYRAPTILYLFRTHSTTP